MRDKSEWQGRTGESWAAMHHETDRSFAALTQRLLERIGEYPGDAVLDIGCGAGELSLAVARARPHARVVGVDVSTNLVEAAQSRAQHHGNARFIAADAAGWSEEGFDPDLLVSRHGVMFFDDPPAAFASLREKSRPGAALVFSCFRSPRENPWMPEIAAMVPGDADAGPPDPHAPGPFAFADPQHVEGILGKAGWSQIDFEPVDYAYVAGHADDPVEDAMRFLTRIGPAAAALAELEGNARAALLQDVRSWLASHRDGNLVAFPAAAWIVTARNA